MNPFIPSIGKVLPDVIGFYTFDARLCAAFVTPLLHDSVLTLSLERANTTMSFLLSPNRITVRKMKVARTESLVKAELAKALLAQQMSMVTAPATNLG